MAEADPSCVEDSNAVCALIPGITDILDFPVCESEPSSSAVVDLEEGTAPHDEDEDGVHAFNADDVAFGNVPTPVTRVVMGERQTAPFKQHSEAGRYVEREQLFEVRTGLMGLYPQRSVTQ